jgi:hypothetical protein
MSKPPGSPRLSSTGRASCSRVNTRSGPLGVTQVVRLPEAQFRRSPASTASALVGSPFGEEALHSGWPHVSGGNLAVLEFGGGLCGSGSDLFDNRLLDWGLLDDRLLGCLTCHGHTSSSRQRLSRSMLPAPCLAGAHRCCGQRAHRQRSEVFDGEFSIIVTATAAVPWRRRARTGAAAATRVTAVVHGDDMVDRRVLRQFPRVSVLRSASVNRRTEKMRN